jgi:hypothetical protein
MYINLNNIDIRARRDECIQAELAKYRLPSDSVEGLVAQVLEDEIHLVFDGVDEMARPYTPDGRKEAMELLRDLGNIGGRDHPLREPASARFGQGHRLICLA